MQYVLDNGQRVQGLVNRRSAEVQLYWSHLWKVAALLLVIVAAMLATAGTLLIA